MTYVDSVDDFKSLVYVIHMLNINFIIYIPENLSDKISKISYLPMPSEFRFHVTDLDKNEMVSYFTEKENKISNLFYMPLYNEEIYQISYGTIIESLQIRYNIYCFDYIIIPMISKDMVIGISKYLKEDRSLEHLKIVCFGQDLETTSDLKSDLADFVDHYSIITKMDVLAHVENLESDSNILDNDFLIEMCIKKEKELFDKKHVIVIN